MNQFSEFFNKVIDEDIKFARNALAGFDGIMQRVDAFLNPIYNDIAAFKNSSRYPSEASTKENVGPSGEQHIRGTRTRSQRNAFKESTQQNTDSPSWANVHVKVEKLSVLLEVQDSPDFAGLHRLKKEAEELSTDGYDDEEDKRTTRSRTRKRVRKTTENRNRSTCMESDKKSDLQDSFDETSSNTTFVASAINKNLNEELTTQAINSTVVVENPVLVMEAKEARTFTPRLTRNKARAMKKQNDETVVLGKEYESQTQTQSKTKEKAKFTPRPPSKIAVLQAQSAPKCGSKLVPFSSKSASALPSSQAENMEKEKIRREKWEEAHKKREAQIQAQIDIKKKRNEEKQLKAQQQREALEKERQKALEEQRVRDEAKHKQLLADLEEKKQKTREENERKRFQIKLKAIEEKNREQERLMEEQKAAEALAINDEEVMMLAQTQRQKEQQGNEQDPKPIYLQEPTPYLPLDDCFDSDEDEFYGTKSCPCWASQSTLEEIQQLGIGAGEHIKNTFFFRQAENADLQKIFEVIDPQKLKRHSSACWQKPPRYTLLPSLQDQEDACDSV